LRHPSPPLTKETDEERAAIIDSVETGIHDVTVTRSVFFGYTPTKVDID